MPRLTVGEWPVSVSNNGVDEMEEAARISVVGDVDVYSIFPRKGTTSGGTVCSVSGNGFGEESECMFGDVSARKSEVVSSTMMVCTSPSHQIGGRVEVRVGSKGWAPREVASVQYEYVAEVGVLQVLPTLGAVNGLAVRWGAPIAIPRYTGFH